MRSFSPEQLLLILLLALVIVALSLSRYLRWY
jgi:hypothetical protein